MVLHLVFDEFFSEKKYPRIHCNFLFITFLEALYPILQIIII